MNTIERATLFATSPAFDAETRAKAAEIMNDAEQLAACFGSELAFGTGGLRGILGVGTARMNRYVVARATQGLADYLKKNGGRSVAIAHDSRLCSDEFTVVAAGVLAANGLTVHAYNRLMPTPMLSFAVRELKCDAGIVITASHNPAKYNGYKVYGADGCQITELAAEEITACIEATAYGAAVPMDEAAAREEGLLIDIEQQVFDAFIAKTLSCRVNPAVDAPVKLVYSPLHGTGLEPVRAILKQMKGVTVYEVAEQTIPDGHFPTCPKPNPELREALTLGLKLSAEKQADLMIATDPDADRVGVAVKNAEGGYDVLTGNEVGLLLMQHVLSCRKANGTLPADPVVVKTIVTSDLAFAIAKDWGVTVTECLTGFKYIGEIIGRLEAKGEESRYVFGFEESCGYLAGAHVRDKDAVMAVTLVTELAQTAAANGTTLGDMLRDLYARYGCMQTRLLNFDIAGAVPMEKMAATMVKMRENPVGSLAGVPVTAVKDYAAGIDGLPKSNVLSYATDDGKKAIIRPSGTEPKVKAYLSANAPTREAAQQLLDVMEKEITAAVLGE